MVTRQAVAASPPGRGVPVGGGSKGMHGGAQGADAEAQEQRMALEGTVVEVCVGGGGSGTYFSVWVGAEASACREGWRGTGC